MYDKSERDSDGRLKKGHKGGPGRPKGSRGILAHSFIRDVYYHWEKSGDDVIKRTISERPHEFLKIVAGLMPQQVEITQPEQELTDAELADKLEQLETLVALAQRAAGNAEAVGGGEGPPPTTH